MWKILTLFCFVPMLLNAQNQFTNAMDSDPDATRVLEQMKEQVHQATDISLDFNFSFEIPGQETYSTAGTIKEKSSLLQVTSSEMTIYSNEKGRWTYTNSENEVNIEDAAEANNTSFFSPREIVKFYDSDQFVYAIEDKVTDDSGAIYTIVFKPLDEYTDYSLIKLDVRESSRFIMEKVYILSKDGSSIHLALDNYEWNTGISDQDFYFDKSLYPNVQIEDLRF